MGLQDREYMHERHRESLRRPKPRAGADFPWKNALMVIALMAFGVFVVTRWDGRHESLPFPSTGEVIWYTGEMDGEGIAAPPDHQRNYAVQLGDWATGKVIATIPIRAGETARLRVPLGQYSITIANGERWFGPEKLFGSSGELRRAVTSMHFYRSGQQTTGHRIDLAKRVDGNLETRPVGPFER
ncbi:MAG: hypothetical protein K0R58_4293 [Ramlibacter sp.]|nr:hypothetical protein [Ramlibacter sp.]